MSIAFQKKRKRQPTLIIAFFQHSHLIEGQSKNILADIPLASYVTWGVGWRFCDKIVSIKMHFMHQLNKHRTIFNHGHI